jgi:hypothetical protein
VPAAEEAEQSRACKGKKKVGGPRGLFGNFKNLRDPTIK